MKNILLISMLLLATFMVSAQKSAKLKIIYFHSEHRCQTCLSIEDNTNKTLKTYFSKQLKEGTISFQSLNMEDKKNLKLVEKYQAEGSSLFLTKMDGTKESTNDLTNFAFSYSRSQPEKFISGLKVEIEKVLK